MPYLNAGVRACVYFERAYTCGNWTDFTLPTIMCGILPVDGKAYKINEMDKSSKLISYLLRKGMGFRYYGLKNNCSRVLFKAKIGRYEPSSIILWHVLNDMLRDEDSFFYLIQCMETHHSWLIGNLEGIILYGRNI